MSGGLLLKGIKRIKILAVGFVKKIETGSVEELLSMLISMLSIREEFNAKNNSSIETINVIRNY